MAPPPELIDDVTAEIFLCLPPDEPACLFRASLVCKRWMRILRDPDFVRQYRAFHRTPPLLGFLHRRTVIDEDPAPRLVPTTAVPAFPHPASCCTPRALDCRHGRVLLHIRGDESVEFLVWDPVTGYQHAVPRVEIDWMTYSAAVLCGVPGCDHIHCRGGRFLVIFIATDDRDGLIRTRVYSSETGAWSTLASLSHGFVNYVQPRRGVLIGNEIFFTIVRGTAIVKHDWRKNCLSVIKPPPVEYYNMVTLMVMEEEDSSLGFIGIRDSNLYLWSRKVNSVGAAEWVQCRVIELETMIPKANPSNGACVVGFAEGVDVIFISTGAGLFMIELKSGRERKVGRPGSYYSILPYMSFYTPGDVRLPSLARTD
ncbi:hypothetical protein QOZ80_7BG0585480 [Eleusine coracana subsp. coracana]|nr:hypothetical protein QOZ80_7BG0585480 [Eleusine coracana subsp. coracana]